MRSYLVLLTLLLGVALAAPLSEIKSQDTDTIDLDEVKRALEESGYFRKVEVRLDGDVLYVKLEPNPPIADVSVESEAFPPTLLAQLLNEELALGPGATFNPVRAQEGADRLARYYRDQGFPFVPEVKLETSEDEQGVHLVYKVEEAVPVEKIKVVGATLFPASELREPFLPLAKAGEFSWALYRNGVDAVNRKYPKRSQLEGGLLTVAVRELKVAEVDASALGDVRVDVPVGEVLNYDHLMDEIARLSREVGREIRLSIEPVGDDQVRIVLSPGPVRYGKIREVRVEGVTALDPEKVKEALRLKPGDLFSPELAQEDFLTIQKLYREAGYEIRPQRKRRLPAARARAQDRRLPARVGRRAPHQGLRDPARAARPTT